MLCMANVPLYVAAIIPYGVIIEENLGGEDELMPMGASGCPINANDFFDNPGLFADYSPESLYQALQSSYNVVPLSKGTYAGGQFSKWRRIQD